MSITTPTLRVQGHGVTSSEPDVVVLHLTVSSQNFDYGETLAELNKRTEALRAAMSPLAVDSGELKTTSFAVTTFKEYESGEYTFRGFRGTHQLDLRLRFDRERLDEVFVAIIGSTARASLDMSFTVSDPEAVRRCVLANAVANARERAEIIAAAGGQRLGRILQMEYGYVEVRVMSDRHVVSEAVASQAPSGPSIRPAEIDSEDNVLVVWELEPVPSARS